MVAVVSVTKFVQEMDAFGEEVKTYLNRETGEFLSVTNDELRLAESLDDEDGDEDESLACSTLDCDEEMLAKIRELKSSDDWVSLPSQYEINEYEIMRSFCESVTDNLLRADLLDAIHGSGAFSRFKGMMGRRNLLDKWYAYREQAFRAIARDWLESHEVLIAD